MEERAAWHIAIRIDPKRSNAIGHWSSRSLRWRHSMHLARFGGRVTLALGDAALHLIHPRRRADLLHLHRSDQLIGLRGHGEILILRGLLVVIEDLPGFSRPVLADFICVGSASLLLRALLMRVVVVLGCVGLCCGVGALAMASSVEVKDHYSKRAILQFLPCARRPLDMAHQNRRRNGI